MIFSVLAVSHFIKSSSRGENFMFNFKSYLNLI